MQSPESKPNSTKKGATIMHDAFQNYSAFGGYPGMIPQGLPYTAHPLAALLSASAMGHGIGFPTAGLAGQGIQNALGQQQLQGLPAQQLFGQSPWANGLQNPLAAALITNPLLAASLQNPLLAAALANPFINYAAYNPVLPQHSPYSQPSQFGPQLGQGQPGIYGQGYPLAPQTWVGQAGPFGGGQPFGQIHPMQAQFGRPY
jgi:hypothetical protein